MRNQFDDMGPGFAGYPTSVDEIDRMMHDLARARQQMIESATTKPMDPKDEQLVSLAHEAGEMKALYRTQKERNDKLEKQINEIAEEDYDGQIATLRSDRNGWKERAEKAEATLKRSRAARRK